MRSNLVGVYPGSFDPITTGHIDIISKAIEVVDELVVAVAKEVAEKHPIFSAQERVEMIENDLALIRESLPRHKKITAVAFDGLLVDFVRSCHSTLIIRGLRAVSDFEYEFQLAAMNSKIASDLQTIFLPATEKSQFTASRIVKELVRLGGDVSDFVSPYTLTKLKEHYRR